MFAREGVLALVDPAPLPAPGRLGLKLARLFERETAAGSSVRLSAALTRLGPTYVKLGHSRRPTSGRRSRDLNPAVRWRVSA